MPYSSGGLARVRNIFDGVRTRAEREPGEDIESHLIADFQSDSSNLPQLPSDSHPDLEEGGFAPEADLFESTIHRHDDNIDASAIELDSESTISDITPVDPPRSGSVLVEEEMHHLLTANPFSHEIKNTLGESVAQTILRLSNEFSPIIETGADTLLYIGPPPQEPGQDDYDYSYVVSHFSRPYLMKSQTLRSTNSARFEKLLGPMSVRAERRLKKLGIHRNIDCTGIKYYIDLRPMRDEDEALLMVTELTCSTGVLSWHQIAKDFCITPSVVCGRDNLDIRPKPAYLSMHLYDTDDDDEGGPEANPRADSGRLQPRFSEKLPAEQEYSSIRHHSALERLLHAIVGNDPKLDSAPKVWTYFSIAKYFDCASNVHVNSHITTWLLSHNNANFIQKNPEVTYRMACGMQAPDTTRITFAMLVGERALTNVDDESDGERRLLKRKSVYGRCLSNLDDDELNRIDHAAHSLSRRIRVIFDDFVSGEMSWLEKIDEFSKLSEIKTRDEVEQATIQKARKTLQGYIRSIFYHALTRQIREAAAVKVDLAQKVGHENEFQAIVYNALPASQRLLARSFWRMLYQYHINQTDFIDDHTVPNGEVAGWQELIPELVVSHDTHGIPHLVDRQQLAEAVEAVNANLRKQQLADLHSKRKAEPDSTPWYSRLRTVVSPSSSSSHQQHTTLLTPQSVWDDTLAFGDEESELPTETNLSQPYEPTENAPYTTINGGGPDPSFSQDMPIRIRGQVRFVPDPVMPSIQPSIFPVSAEVQPTAVSRKLNQQRRFRAQEELLRRRATRGPSRTPSPPPSAYPPLGTPSRATRGPSRTPSPPPSACSPLSAPIQTLPTPPRKPAIAPNPFISMKRLCTQLTDAIQRRITHPVLRPGYLDEDLYVYIDTPDVYDTDMIPIKFVPTLLCLNDDEWKYLPLWAGGNDDGSGGVFAEVDVPDTFDAGFRGGKMGLSVDFKGKRRDNADSDYDMADDSTVGDVSDGFTEVATDDAVSTVGKASRIATDGTRRGASTVISLDE